MYISTGPTSSNDGYPDTTTKASPRSALEALTVVLTMFFFVLRPQSCPPTRKSRGRDTLETIGLIVVRYVYVGCGLLGIANSGTAEYCAHACVHAKQN